MSTAVSLSSTVTLHPCRKRKRAMNPQPRRPAKRPPAGTSSLPRRRRPAPAPLLLDAGFEPAPTPRSRAAVACVPAARRPRGASRRPRAPAKLPAHAPRSPLPQLSAPAPTPRPTPGSRVAPADGLPPLPPASAQSASFRRAVEKLQQRVTPSPAAAAGAEAPTPEHPDQPTGFKAFVASPRPQLPPTQKKARRARPGLSLSLAPEHLNDALPAPDPPVAASAGVCSRVTDFLFVGGAAVARSEAALAACGVTHILNCAGAEAVPNAFPGRFAYRTLELRDRSSADVCALAYAVVEFVEAARREGGRVLLHCVKGISRSPSLAILYLMWARGCPFDEAFRAVKAARPVSNPNPGFVFQLSAWPASRVSVQSPGAQVVFAVEANGQPAVPALRGPVVSLPEDFFEHPPESAEAQVYVVAVAAAGAYVWHGRRAPRAAVDVAHAAVRLLQRYEGVGQVLQVVEEGDDLPEALESLDLSHDSL